MDIQVPQFTQRMKTIVEDLGELMLRRRSIADRLRDGGLYFKRELSSYEVSRGLQTVAGLIAELERVDIQIRDLQTEYAIIIEERFAGIKFQIVVPATESETGEMLGQRIITFNPVPSEEMMTISPDDIWFLQIAKKLFNASASSIEFL